MVQALAEQEQKTAKELHLLMEKQTRRLVELEKRLEQKGEYAKREMHQSVSKRLQVGLFLFSFESMTKDLTVLMILMTLFIFKTS